MTNGADALRVLEQTLVTQSAMLAFDNTFLFVCASLALLAALVLLLKATNQAVP